NKKSTSATAAAKKAATTKVETKAPAKKAAVAAKSEKVAEKNTVSAPAKTAAKETKTKQSSTPAKKPANKQPVVTAVPSARSEIVDAVRPLPRKTTPKPGVVIAHRKIEKKVTEEEPGITMKEYNPSVRSLVDEPEQNAGPVYRYSDEELNEFKELITKRLDNARK